MVGIKGCRNRHLGLRFKWQGYPVWRMQVFKKQEGSICSQYAEGEIQIRKMEYGEKERTFRDLF